MLKCAVAALFATSIAVLLLVAFGTFNCNDLMGEFSTISTYFNLKYVAWSYYHHLDSERLQMLEKPENDWAGDHDHVQPTLLSVIDTSSNRLVNAMNNTLYELLLRPDTIFHVPESGGAAAWADPQLGPIRMKDVTNCVSLDLSSPTISFDEPLLISWRECPNSNSNMQIHEQDVLAMYCPAGESNPRKFREAATIQQARLATLNARSNGDLSGTSFREMGLHVDGLDNGWIIPSFPIIREESCEFRLWSRLIHSSLLGGGIGQELELSSSVEGSQNPTHFSQVATSGPVHLEKSMVKPTALHLALTNNPEEMRVHFTTGGRLDLTGKALLKGSLVIPVVRYAIRDSGTKRQSREAENTGKSKILRGNTSSYEATDMCMSPANETGPAKFVHPGLLHAVTLTDLIPDTEYKYEAGVLLRGEKEAYIWSKKKYTFRSAPPTGLDHEPFHFIVYGDEGCPETGWTMGAKKVVKRIKKAASLDSSSRLGAVHHIGDLAYARGVAHIWDFWLHMIQPVASRVPLMVGVGNHEYDHTSGGENGKDPSGVKAAHGFRPSWGNFGDDSRGECGVPVSKRFVMPQNGNGVFWYSFDYASTHIVMLSSEHDLSPMSRQYSWLQRDLANVKRDITPWLIVELHRPLYNSFNLSKQMLVGIGMRGEFEPLLYEYDVDLVIAGHYHSYHRSCHGLYQGLCNNGGPTHITVGTAGARLTTANEYKQNWTEAVLTEWGYGRVTVANSTALLFEFVSDDAEGTVQDYVWIIK